MASCFKASCAIYWLVWFITFSYLIGLQIFQSKYLIWNDTFLQESNYYCTLVSYVSIAVALVGCIFVKCGVSHIICFVLYIVPLIGVLPALSISGMVKSKKVKENDVKLTYLAELVQKSYAKRNASPGWLKRAETGQCCGIFTYKDYQVLFGFHRHGASGCSLHNATDKHTNGSDIHSWEVPQTCCAKKDCLHDLHESISIPFKEVKILLTDGVGDEEEQWETSWEKENYAAFKKSTTDDCFPYINPEFKSHNPDWVHFNGCGKYIIEQRNDLATWNEYLCTLMLIAAIAMTIIYVRTCFQQLEGSDSQSEHSLDQDDPYVVDIPRIYSELDLVRLEDQVEKDTKANEKANLLIPIPSNFNIDEVSKKVAETGVYIGGHTIPRVTFSGPDEKSQSSHSQARSIGSTSSRHSQKGGDIPHPEIKPTASTEGNNEGRPSMP